MIYVRMTNGNVQEKKEVESDVHQIGFKGGKIDNTATKEAHRIAKLCAAAGHFVETGVRTEVSKYEEKYGEQYWWLIKNCGDNCIKIFPKPGTRFGSLPRFNMVGDYVEDSDRTGE